MMLDKGNYLTVDEYRRIIGYCSTGAIRMAIKQGRLDAKKIGKQWLIDKNAILQTNRTGMAHGKFGKYKERRQQIESEIRAAGIDPAEIYGRKV